VTLVDPAGQILAGYSAELREEIGWQLDELGIRLILGSRLAADPAPAPGQSETFTIATETGEEITADLWFRCHGVSPVSDYLTGSLAAARLRTAGAATRRDPLRDLPAR
jgi:NADPH-dependent 2,4-dienoyl-CoA reductase/sulfur reductase-like enzyme